MKKRFFYSSYIQWGIPLLLCATFTVFCYTALHEGGHALAGVISGGSVQRINVNFLDFSAHTRLNGSFTPTQNAVISVSGWALPVLAAALFMLLTRANSNPIIQVLRWLSVIVTLGSTLPWVVLPLVFLAGNAPPDDVTSFLNYAALPPLAVSLAFAALCAAGVWLLLNQWRRVKIFGKWLRSTPGFLTLPAVRRGLSAMLLAACVIGGLLVTLNGLLPNNAVPDGYQLAVRVDLANAQPEGEAVYAFEKRGPGQLGYFMQVRDIRTDLLDVSLHGPDGWRTTLLHGEGYSAAEFTFGESWKDLPAGRYELVISGTPARGVVTVYILP
jgi:hypothetical protein